jgi:nucleoside-diphosphate-sugar epimerase
MGTNAVQRLLELGAEVTNLDLAPPRNPAHAGRWLQADLLDAAAIVTAVKAVRPSYVVHLGARTDLAGSAIDDYAVNTEGTRNLIAALGALESAPALVAASSRLVCRIGYQPHAEDDYCPPNAYGESKVQSELIVRSSNYPGPCVIVRPTSIWGPWFGVPYRTFFLAVAKGRYLHPAGKRIRKSFGYVENTVHQILRLLTADRGEVDGRVFYVADYEPIEVADWAARIQRATGAPPLRSAPVALLRVMATAGDVLKGLGWKDPPLTRFRLDNLLTEMMHDLAPVRRVAPELPVPLDLGITRTVEWLRRQGDLPPN